MNWVDSETSAKMSLNVEASFTSLIRAILRARALDTLSRKPNSNSRSQSNGSPFNPNNAIVEDILARQQESRKSVTVDEKTRTKKKNQGLSMDRNHTKSIGGLADGEKKSSCCLVQ